MNKPVVLFQRSAEEKPAETAKVAKGPAAAPISLSLAHR